MVARERPAEEGSVFGLSGMIDWFLFPKTNLKRGHYCLRYKRMQNTSFLFGYTKV